MPKIEELNLEEVIYFLIDTTTRKMRRYSHQVLREAGLKLTLDQFVVLKMLEENPGISQVEVGERLYKDNASVTRIIDLLVKKEFVNRDMSKKDRRTFAISLTPIGQSELERTKEVVYAIRKKGIEGLSEEEMETTKRVLRTIQHRFE